MSKNTCPCCGGHSEYLDVPSKTSAFLCTGCEIKHYFEIHKIMNEEGISKEDAFKKLN